MSVKVNIESGWDTKRAKAIQRGLLEMSNDILVKAIVLAPKETGALDNSGIVEPVLGGYKIQFGSARVPYARRRHFENRKNPQTLGYLARAGDGVARGDTGKYFRGKA